tara:strand:- start:597 stop:971 length:375 start_codon:yes stop_codon:yes gene_type:complete
VRVDEFANSSSNPEDNLVTALELIRNRYKDDETLPKISTQSIIKLVLNTDRTFDYDALVSANENNPAIKNLIKSFNKDYVELHPAGNDGENDSTTTNTDGKTGTANTVNKMAKRAAKKRSKSTF